MFRWFSRITDEQFDKFTDIAVAVLMVVTVVYVIIIINLAKRLGW
jgi:hypothetical protein